MPLQLKTIRVAPASEFGQLLKEAAETQSVLETNGARYCVSRVDASAPAKGAPRRRQASHPHDDPLLWLIGILDEGEPTDIARFKDQYIADAVDRRGE